jgi:hypothetical protein
VLQAKKFIPTPYLSTIFTFGLAIESIKELWVHQEVYMVNSQLLDVPQYLTLKYVFLFTIIFTSGPINQDTSQR